MNRPGVTVLYRHGYNASSVVVPTDRHAFLAYRRVAAAAHFPEPIRDLRVQIKASVARDERKVAREALVEAVVQLDRVVFKTLDDRHVAKLDISVFCADARERLVGELWQFMDLKLKDATYERMKKEGVPYTAKVALRGEPKWVKVVVYDYEADLVGSVVFKLK